MAQFPTAFVKFPKRYAEAITKPIKTYLSLIVLVLQVA